jgi:predicted AAA+ superfamily ATPase
MRLLLTSAVRREAGTGGEPVVQVKTAFGGGKTYTMLALYHLLRGEALAYNALVVSWPEIEKKAAGMEGEVEQGRLL